MKSENWGGVAMWVGDLSLLFSGDIPGVSAIVPSIATNYVCTKYAETSKGYSATCLLVAMSDGLFSQSEAMCDNPLVQFMLAGTAMTYVVGSLRYPLELVAKKARHRHPRLSKGLQNTADALQPIVCAVSFAQLVPAIGASLNGMIFNKSNFVSFIATTGWGISDLLLGNLKEKVFRPAANFIHKRYGRARKSTLEL